MKPIVKPYTVREVLLALRYIDHVGAEKIDAERRRRLEIEAEKNDPSNVTDDEAMLGKIRRAGRRGIARGRNTENPNCMTEEI